MTPVLYLDAKSDCHPPDGAVAVATDVDFLRILASRQNLVARGDALCHWAAKVWLGRGWTVCSLSSPADELADCAIGANSGQMAQLYEEHVRTLSQLVRPFRLQQVLEAIYPEILWRTQPSPVHAATWLVWLDKIDPPGPVLPLLRTQAMLWRATCKGVESILYDAHDAQKARELLAAWLGYGEASVPADLPPFPLEVPQRHLDAAARTWRSRIVTTKGQYTQALLHRKLPRRVREKAAELAWQYYEANRGDLSQQVIRTLSDYLTPMTTAQLRNWLPPPSPGDPPADLDQLRPWFTDEYMPYRQWCLSSEDPCALDTIRRRSRQFALWYLEFYPAAISGGNDSISFVRSARIRAAVRPDVTLFIVADGLCVTDAQTLIRELASQDQRLSVTANDLVFSPVPTITSVCKPALMYGCAPRDAERATGDRAAPPVHFLPENRDPAEALRNSSPGDFFIWSHPEPDHTYHSHADKNTLLQKVDGALRSIAGRISSAAAAVPPHHRLRIIVTTDHGRLLGHSPREITIPRGMESHQRVALGPSVERIPAPGYQVQPESPTAFLDGLRFGISDSQDCCIALSDSSFLANDGRSGVEHFPHGGLFPEEVLIPWCEIVRDQEPPHVECTATGAAREGRSGQVTIRCVNAGQVDLNVLAVEFKFREKPKFEIHFNVPLPRMSEKVLTGEIQDWPTPSDLRAATAIARIRLPIGDEDALPVAIELKTEGFQDRENILGDLL